ncbi:hypothetical protein BCON_0066g00150 [Botryotinia convoluta]|uniref:Uncharacterized protein n=1 Tax=Botryotinia convoluta TaxID=54673 RepID=A0A4Z1I7C4_9HELO|nr:hypothetical protein BCON_0066g00150 [Botryotinia convoluta]
MTSEASRANSRRSDGRYADSGTKGSDKSSRVGLNRSGIEQAESNRASRVGSTRSRNERRRSVESLESNTRDLDIGGGDSPQPPESPGDTVDPSTDTQLLNYEVNWKALERFKNNKGQDSEVAGDGKRPRRRRRSPSPRKEKPVHVQVRVEEKERRRSRSPPVKRTITTRTTYRKLGFLDREKTVEDTSYYRKRRSDNHDNDKNLSSSDQRYGDPSRPSTRKEKHKNTERKTKESSPAGSDVSSPKTSVDSKSNPATSTRHGAPTHRSASVRDNDDQVPRAGSHHSSKSASSLNEYDGVDNEPSPGEPKALSGGPASGSLHGRPPRSNTSALGRHSLKESNLNNIYKPDRGGKGTSTATPSDHGSAERAPTGYGKGVEKNQPYAYEDRTKHYKPPGSTSSKASRRTSTTALSNHAKSERAPSSCGEAAEDQSCKYEDETRQSNASGSTSSTARVRRS